MSMIKKISTFFVIFIAFASNAAFAADSGQKLFVNLTSDEMNRASMAIGISTKVLQKEKIPVTILLNVEAVRIADKNIPEHKHASGKSLKQMLAGFIKAGGRVIVCPMCMENVGGMGKDDLIAGVEVGGPAVTFPALLAEDTTVLSY